MHPSADVNTEPELDLLRPMRPDFDSLPIAFFDQQVLASYKAEPDRWAVSSDNFDGCVEIAPSYYDSLVEREREQRYIEVRFGYRALASGELALAAWLPDLVERSPGHVDRWNGFLVRHAVWSDRDPRFDSWYRRYIEGDWGVENGVRARLASCIATIRAVTGEVLETPLFRSDIPATLPFPAAENSHRYEDAHRELYGYLIDGIEKKAIVALANRLGRPVQIGSDRTLEALNKVIPDPTVIETFSRACLPVQGNRRLATHGVRPPAVRFPAFETFSGDLELCVTGCLQLLGFLEECLGVQGATALRRQAAMVSLPKVGRPAEPHYSINQARRMVGKTVESVEFGFRQDSQGLHQSELLICRFSDGSILAIDTGSNAQNIASVHKGVSPEDFHVDLHLHWVQGPREREWSVSDGSQPAQ